MCWLIYFNFIFTEAQKYLFHIASPLTQRAYAMTANMHQSVEVMVSATWIRAQLVANLSRSWVERETSRNVHVLKLVRWFKFYDPTGVKYFVFLKNRSSYQLHRMDCATTADATRNLKSSSPYLLLLSSFIRPQKWAVCWSSCGVHIRRTKVLKTLFF